jgi:hypothetical protein
MRGEVLFYLQNCSRTCQLYFPYTQSNHHPSLARLVGRCVPTILSILPSHHEQFGASAVVAPWSDLFWAMRVYSHISIPQSIHLISSDSISLASGFGP